LPEKETRYSLEFAEQPDPEASVDIVSVESSWTEYEYMSDSGSIDGVEINIENIEAIEYTPKVGLTITRGDEEIYSSTDAVTFFSALEPGSMTTEDILLYETIEQSGEYQFEVSVRVEDSTEVLASDTFSKVIE